MAVGESNGGSWQPIATPRRSARSQLLTSAAFASGALAVLCAAPHPAQAQCAITAAPNVVNCAVNTTTTDTTNTNAATANSSDRHQQFTAGGNVTATVQTGVTVDGFGLSVQSTEAGAKVDITNSGTVSVGSGNTPTKGSNGALTGIANGGNVTYAGNGAVTSNDASTAGLLLTNTGAGTVSVGTVGTPVSGSFTGTQGIALQSVNGNSSVFLNGGSVTGTAAGVGAGVFVSTTGTGAASITTTGGTVVSTTTTGFGLIGQATSGGVTITTDAAIGTAGARALTGIQATNSGGVGGVTIGQTGGTIFSNTTGIVATNAGTGGAAVTMSNTAVINGSAGTGIKVESTGLTGDAVVNLNATGTSITGVATGVSASVNNAAGFGNVQVSQTAGIVQTTGDGIVATSNGSGLMTVSQTGGQIGTSTAARVGGIGISATSSGTGNVTVNVTNVFAEKGGALATITNAASAGNASVTVLAGGTVDGTSGGANHGYGVLAQNAGSGIASVQINDGATVHGDLPGAASITAGGDAIQSIGNNASVTGSSGVAVDQTSAAGTGVATVTIGTNSVIAGDGTDAGDKYNGNGIFAGNQGTGLTKVETGTGTTVDGTANGIFVSQTNVANTNNIIVTTGGAVTATGATPFVLAPYTNAFTTTTGLGIAVANSGSGNITVTANANVSATTGAAVNAAGIQTQNQNGTTDININNATVLADNTTGAGSAANITTNGNATLQLATFRGDVLISAGGNASLIVVLVEGGAVVTGGGIVTITNSRIGDAPSGPLGGGDGIRAVGGGDVNVTGSGTLEAVVIGGSSGGGPCGFSQTTAGMAGVNLSGSVVNGPNGVCVTATGAATTNTNQITDSFVTGAAGHGLKSEAVNGATSNTITNTQLTGTGAAGDGINATATAGDITNNVLALSQVQGDRFGINQTSAGNQTTLVDNASVVGGTGGISAVTTGATATVTVTAQNASSVDAKGGNGITTSAIDGKITVTIGSAAGDTTKISATANGVNATSTGIGGITVDMKGGQIGTDKTTRVGGIGINAVTSGVGNTAGDIVINARNVFATTGGVIGDITNAASTGNVGVTVLSGSTVDGTNGGGNHGYGVLARTAGSGSATVTIQDGAIVHGDLPGAASVTAGGNAIQTIGNNATVTGSSGVVTDQTNAAGAGVSTVTIGTNSKITGDGTDGGDVYNGNGIFAGNQGSGLSSVATGVGTTVTGTANGIFLSQTNGANANNIVITADGSSTGQGTTAFALAPYTTALTANGLPTTGLGIGVSNVGPGSTTVNAGAGTTTEGANGGAGILALSTGAGNIGVNIAGGATVTGGATATGLLLSQVGTGSIVVNNSGTIIGDGVANQVIWSETTAAGTTSTINNFAGGVIRPNSNARGELAIFSPVFTGAFTINNAGTLTGRVDLTNGADTVNNSGTWNVTGTNNFYLGGDTIANSGQLNAGVLPGVSVTRFTSTGLQTVNNSGIANVNGTANFTGAAGSSFNNLATGTLTMQNGNVTDRTTTSAGYNYAGTAGSRLAVDINLGANTAAQRADQLNVGGNTSGTTAVNFAPLNGNRVFFATPIPIVTAGAASTATFTVENPAALASNGVVQYSFEQVSQGNWSVVSRLNTAAVASTVTSIVSSLASIDVGFHQPAGALVASQGGTEPNKWTGGIWTRATGGQATIDATGVDFGPGSLGPVSSQVRTRYAGFQSGLDSGVLNIGGSGLNMHFGLTGGFVTAKATELLGVGRQMDFELPFFGVYATATINNWFGDITVRHDSYNMNVTNLAAGLTNFGFDGEAWNVNGTLGYHLDLGHNWFIEPQVGLSKTRSSFDILPILSGNNQQLLIPDLDSLLGRVGARVGTTIVTENVALTPFVVGSLWHEFEDTASSFFQDLAGGTIIPVEVTRVGTFGQASVGMSGILLRTGWLGFARADARFGENIEGWAFNAGLRYTFN